MLTIRGWSKDWQYFLLCIVLWCFVPELRRVLDWRSGAFSSVQILSILPLLSVAPLMFWAFKKERRSKLSPQLKFFAIVWMIGQTYAFLVGLVSGNASAAVYSYLSYVIPVIGALWIATQDLAPAATLRRTATIVVGCGGIVGLYGIAQFISPPPWDVFWVINAHMDSVGPTEPFMMRVFSTINSQGVCAEFLAIALLYGLSTSSLRGLLNWPLMAAVAASLVLTLVRSAWIGLVAGLAVYLLMSPRRLRVMPIVLVFAGITAFFVVALPTLLGDAQGGQQIVDRLNTFNDLGSDTSALDRQSEVSSAFTAANRNPIGGGLGGIGPAAKLSGANGGDAVVLDSGYLARFTELGYFGFVAYLLVIFGTLATLLFRIVTSARRIESEDRNAMAAATAMCVTMLTFELGGDTYGGIMGVFAWLAIGIGFHATFNSLASKTLSPLTVCAFTGYDVTFRHVDEADVF